MPLRTPSYITPPPPTPCQISIHSWPFPPLPSFMSPDAHLTHSFDESHPIRDDLQGSKRSFSRLWGKLPKKLLWFNVGRTLGTIKPQRRKEVHLRIITHRLLECGSPRTSGPQSYWISGLPSLIGDLGATHSPPKFIPSDNYTLTSGRAGPKPDGLGSDPTSTSH